MKNNVRRSLNLEVVSDTHDQYRDIALRGADVLIHCGDATSVGHESDIIHFLEWLGSQPHQYKIFVPGNHDIACELEPDRFKRIAQEQGVQMLINDAIEIEGVKFYGSPYVPGRSAWAFTLPRDGDCIAACWDMIPDDVEVLITHTPAYQTLDYAPRIGHLGCRSLLKRLSKLENLIFHIFGHIHPSRGSIQKFRWISVNAATCNDRNELVQKTGTQIRF